MECQYFLVRYLTVGIMMLSLAAIGYCKQFSSPFPELGRPEYVVEEYFQKHGNLLDWVFQDFIAHELPLGFCEVLKAKQKIVPRLSVMRRQLFGEGFHRRLISSLRFDSQLEVLSELHSHFCEAVIVERLPSGVFADPFELEHLTERGVFSSATVFGDTDLELPTVRANRSVVEIHMDMGPNMLSGNKIGLELNIELPLHARYAPLGEHGYARVQFGSPDLFIHCIVEGNSSNESCIFSSTNYSTISNSDAIIWEVPCGILGHARVVSILTFISAVASTSNIEDEMDLHAKTQSREGQTKQPFN